MENDNWLVQIVEPLLEWFQNNARELPWRALPPKKPDPYHVWVSEIMLQQTRVEAVKPYFERFIHALSDIPALASCPEDRLLKLWEGLGYYNRVRNMQKAARVVTEQYGGKLPEDFEALLALPGIGSYTAGAIGSIAYGIPQPAVDGNVLRVICRFTENNGDISRQSVKARIEREVKRILPVDRPGMFNQSLMELGATVCLPNGAPECDHCPIAGLCKAREHGTTQLYPVKKEKPARKVEERTVLVIRDGQYTAIKKRPSKGLLAGLYELPNLEGYWNEDDVLVYLKENHFSPVRIQTLPSAKHIFSHVEWRMKGYIILVEQMEMPDSSNFLIVEPERTEEEYPIPAAFAAYTGYLQIRLGQEKFRGQGSTE